MQNSVMNWKPYIDAVYCDDYDFLPLSWVTPPRHHTPHRRSVEKASHVRCDEGTYI